MPCQPVLQVQLAATPPPPPHTHTRFQRSEMLSLLLTPASSEARKRLPSETSPDLAASIRKEFSLSLWQHKGEWPVYFVTQLTTFTLPSGVYMYVQLATYQLSNLFMLLSVYILYSGGILDIRKFCSSVQKKVLDEVVDRDVEQGTVGVQTTLSCCTLALPPLPNWENLTSAHVL